MGALLFALAAAVVAGCSPGPGAGRAATGVVIAIDSSGGAVRGFTLRADDGHTFAFTIGQLETGGEAFPASHLVAHAVSLEPIAVAYREEGSALVAYRLTDAPGASPSG